MTADEFFDEWWKYAPIGDMDKEDLCRDAFEVGRAYERVVIGGPFVADVPHAQVPGFEVDVKPIKCPGVGHPYGCDCCLCEMASERENEENKEADNAEGASR